MVVIFAKQALVFKPSFKFAGGRGGFAICKPHLGEFEEACNPPGRPGTLLGA